MKLRYFAGSTVAGPALGVAPRAADAWWAYARDRLFEMDLMRRAGSGRLSEILGPLALANDEVRDAVATRCVTLPAASAELETTR